MTCITHLTTPSFYTHHHGFSLLNLNTQKMSFFYLFLPSLYRRQHTLLLLLFTCLSISCFYYALLFFMIKADISMTAIYFFVAYVSLLVRNVLWSEQQRWRRWRMFVCAFLLCVLHSNYTQILNQLISCQIKEKLLLRKWVMGGGGAVGKGKHKLKQDSIKSQRQQQPN